MERPRRRPEPAAIDITWVSCRGVKSSLPFHTPCLYASVYVASSSASSSSAHGHRRHHRVKTPTDRAGGENPEWDAPVRLYLPAAAVSPPEAAAGGKNKKDGSSDDGVLLVKFELKAEVAVLGDVHTASAAVPVPDLVADGRTRRVSYQLVGPDGRQPNGVVSFSYAFHGRNDDDDCRDGEPATPPYPATPAAVALPLPTIIAAKPRLYPAIEWELAEQPPVYPPLTAMHFTIADTQCYPPPPASLMAEVTPAKPASVYPPPPALETSFCSVYPTVEPANKASALYPTVDLAPVNYYPPAMLYGVECGYAASPGWGDGDWCLYG
jgi:hypothetical protein